MVTCANELAADLSEQQFGFVVVASNLRQPFHPVDAY
jgi:hypothetical protein